MDRQAWDALVEHINALEAKFAAQAEALRAARVAAPPPLAPPPTLRQERAALWRIAMLCKDALRNRAVPPEMRPYFLQIARVCREGIRRADSNRGDHGT
jgi:hypothetical protein